MQNNKDENLLKPTSELRFDLVSKDWVVIATGRAKRPEAFAQQKREEEKKSAEDCFFCDLKDQLPPVLEYKDGKGEWEVAVIPNKYPAFFHSKNLHERALGPYSLMDGVGFHEVVLTRDHEKSLAQLPVEQIRKLIDAYQERYLELTNEENVNYI